MNDEFRMVTVRADVLRPAIGMVRAHGRARLNRETFDLTMATIFPPLGWHGRKDRLQARVLSSQTTIAFLTEILDRIDVVLAEETAA